MGGNSSGRKEASSPCETKILGDLNRELYRKKGKGSFFPISDEKKNQTEALTSSTSKKSSEMGGNSSDREGAFSRWETEIVADLNRELFRKKGKWSFFPMLD
ncbi:hypothetical protein MRB53_032598 [Persea americana]|uniref:Uncharacterized protein n=1 Tax=Persea americana TaxID=3435 RepID=A0ACC2KSZ1_PERAE|nr:hypothetical protein MRB53_032598 [Persea americana]